MSIDLFIQVVFLFFFCLILAALETQIEGEAGWAANLPTWRPPRSGLVSRLYGRIMGGRELTLYHVLIFTLVAIFLHYPYFSGKDWSLAAELTTISFFLLVVIVWDFLWFVVNPRYDFRRFWGRHVLWHKKWFLHLPIDYWFAIAASALLYARFSSLALLGEWLKIIAVFLVFTLAIIFFANAVGVLKIKEEFRQ